MKDFALELVARQTSVDAKKNALREYLQVYVLRILADEGFFRGAAFVGGTALRLVHGLRRFSEDLDFSMTDKAQFSFESSMQAVKSKLTIAGYDVVVSINSDNIVNKAMVKLKGLMHEAGVSPMPSQVLLIKIEVDTRPPDGAVLEQVTSTRFIQVSMASYDLPSLFASKLHALLFRKYAKGRDYYDLVWYLGKRVEPNIRLLNNAARQSGYDGEAFTQGNYRALLARKVERADFKRLREDVEVFLEDKSELRLFDRKLFLGMMK